MSGTRPESGRGTDKADRGSDSASSWLPPVDLSGESSGADEETASRGLEPGSEPGPDRQRVTWRAALPVGLVGVALAFGVAFGVLASDEDGGGDSPGAGLSSAELLPRAQLPRVKLAGALGPSKALSLAVAVQTQDQLSNDRGEPAFDPEIASSVGPATKTPIRAQYVLRLAAVGAVLRELGRKASRVRDAAGLGREDDRVREALQRLNAVAGNFEDSIYRRSRDLDARVAATIAGMEERLGPGREEELQRLGRRLSALGGSISRRLQEAAAAAVDRKTIQAGRLFARAERRLAALERTI